MVTAGLYLDGNGPHTINSFGCTICHGGQGSGTDFTYASHEPNDLEQKEELGGEVPLARDPPLGRADAARRGSCESSCLKCHHQVTDVPQAKKLQAGYERITKYGCTGCHTIGGEGSFGPDLTDERQVGPNLAHLGSKVTRDWTLKWIKNPHAFRPDTRMPRFYGVTNNDAPERPAQEPRRDPRDHPLPVRQEHAARRLRRPARQERRRQGQGPLPPEGLHGLPLAPALRQGDVQLADRETSTRLQARRGGHVRPERFPESVRDYAKADFGPNLRTSRPSSSRTTKGYKWLANWIKAPESYHPKSLMPNLQLSLAGRRPTSPPGSSRCPASGP